MSTLQRKKIRMFAAKYRQETGQMPPERMDGEPPRDWAFRCANELMSWAVEKSDEYERDGLMMTSRNIP